MVVNVARTVCRDRVISAEVTLAPGTKRGPAAASSVAMPAPPGPRLSVVSAMTVASGAENPFTALMTATVGGTTVPDLRLTEGGDLAGAACEPSFETLALLVELERRLAGRGHWLGGRVREGMRQVTEDAQEERAARLALERDASRELARVVVASSAKADEKTLLHAHEWRAKLGRYCTGGDVNAFVQQVLRETYLMGNLELQIYADRVKAMNELKKKIREEADRARRLKSAWAAAASGDDTWVSPTAYQAVKVDNAQMALLPDVWTAADLPSVAPSTSPAPVGPGAAGEAFFAEGSGLTPQQQSRLIQIAGIEGKTIADTLLDELKGLIGAMNAADIETYLVPVMDVLRADGHTGSVVHLIEAMTQEQVLLVAAHGFCPANQYVNNASGLGLGTFDGSELETLVSIQRTATIDLFGDAIPRERYGTPVTPAEAQELVAQLRARATEPPLEEPVAVPSGPAEGDPKNIDTVAEMADYLRYLEDQMSSLGDDAQLANVDLQNCLQKQQQTLQLMSNIGKMLHEICIAIIRNTNA